MRSGTVFERPSATILPFRDAAIREPIDLTLYRAEHQAATAGEGAAADNVVVLAQYARRGRRFRRVLLAPPPDGEAA
jgi:hypothetical protein